MNARFWGNVEVLANSREADVETWLVLPLLEALGHERRHIASKVPILFQEGREKRPGRKPEADFVVYAEIPFCRANSLIVVETKRSDESLDDGKEQGESYAQNLKSPILLMTNGICLEIWQMQISAESVRVFACEVAALATRQGDIEAILSKDAILSHCSILGHKHFDVLARDFGAYERALHGEVCQTAASSVSINLIDTATKRKISSAQLIALNGRGAVIVGPSGYGKTTLSGFLLCEAIESRWEDTATVLPVGVFLPDAVLHGRTLEEFLVERIASHKPGFTLAALRRAAREQGILIIADGFERVAPEYRDRLEGSLRTLMRDYPRTRLFVMSRGQVAPSGLGLPVLQLSGYTIDELRKLADLRSIDRPNVRHVFTGAPDHVYRLAEVPLLADLIISRYSSEHPINIDIVSLYEEWLDRILASSRPIERALDRELLEEIAIATEAGPIALARAIELCRHHSSSERTLHSLAEADALSIRGTTVELQHEGLADYLRALCFWNENKLHYAEKLELIAFDISSQFPILLVATAPNADARGVAWQAIVRRDMQLAVSSLRFAAGSETFGSNAEGDAKRVLTDIQSTIEAMVTTHLRPIGNLIREEIAGRSVETLGIRGSMGQDDIAYAFFEARDTPEVVRLFHKAQWERAPRMYGHALRRVGYGPEAGRIIGTERVKAALDTLTKARRLRGGRVWTEERVFGRLRHLIREYDAPVSNLALRQAYEVLESEADMWVAPSGLGNGQQFPMRELLDDVAFLLEEGVSKITPWWDDFDNLDFNSVADRQLFSRTVDVYHRRRQIAYAEIVESSLPNLIPHLQTYRMMPLRYEIEAEIYTRNGFNHPSINYRRFPVSTFDEAGADVSFPQVMSDWDTDDARRSYGDLTDALLKRFGRWFDGRSVEWGSSYRVLDLHGRDTTFDGSPDESVIVRGAMSWLKRDLKYLFSEMPSYRYAP